MTVALLSIRAFFPFATIFIHSLVHSFRNFVDADAVVASFLFSLSFFVSMKVDDDSRCASHIIFSKNIFRFTVARRK